MSEETRIGKCRPSLKTALEQCELRRGKGMNGQTIKVNVMFTFRIYTIITTVYVEDIEDAVKTAQELLGFEGVRSEGAQDIAVEVLA
jgi:hypothetical protein